MLQNIENQPAAPAAGQQKENNNFRSTHRLSSGLIISIIILSVLSGTASGAVATWYFSKQINSGLPLFSARPTKVSEDSAIIDVVDKASPAVVSIVASKDISQQNQLFYSPFFFDPFFQFRSQGDNQKKQQPDYQDVSAGSGFLVSADGMILTNKHVVADAAAKYTVYLSDGKKYDAKVLSTDPLNDIALVKIEISKAPILNLADSAQIKIGQRVIAIGNSLGQYKNTVTSGIVSGIGRNITAGGEGLSEQLEGVIQTDAAINPGNSGGPLLNIFGEVIGVNTAIDQQGQLVGFAIPANDAKKSIDSYKKFGKIVKPFLGVRYIPVDQTVKEKNNLPVDYGALVISGTESDGSQTPAVVKDSAADKAGIKNNDIILSINGVKLDSNHSLAGEVKKYNPGDVLSVEIMREKQILKLSVTLGESK